MIREINIPTLGESVQQATIVTWKKTVGEFLKEDEILLELETEKIALEVYAPCSGVLQEIIHGEGSLVAVGEIVGRIQENENTLIVNSFSQAAVIAPPVVPQTPSSLKESRPLPEALAAAPIPETVQPLPALSTAKESPRVVPLSPLRRRIAERLKEAQNTAAILTTFNEIDMSRVMELRKTYGELFQKKHGVRLGLMSFFVKATAYALKQVPEMNAALKGEEIFYYSSCEIGVAVSLDTGIVVPVLRRAETLSFAEIEGKIHELATKARSKTLSLEELQGGTFTISNGGGFGSLFSTPILNTPQTGILGMHKIQERPVVISGNLEIRPMMYVALSYDHRLIDGQEAIGFLVLIKELIEAPERLLFDL